MVSTAGGFAGKFTDIGMRKSDAQRLRHHGIGRGIRAQGPGRCSQRWRALKRGLDLQITKTLPRRRTTLQSRWRAFADFREDRTYDEPLMAKQNGEQRSPA